MENSKCAIPNVELKNTTFGYTLSLIGGKYKMTVLFWLFEHQPALRYNELKRRIGTISFKTLTNTLRELEHDGLVIRTEYPQIPPKVEYSLSEKGLSIIPILELMCDWGAIHRPDLVHMSSTKENDYK